ncbi:MAG: hypothetical protein ACI87L_000692 [Litorivivens sp.]|jgi:hypothetical protein
MNKKTVAWRRQQGSYVVIFAGLVLTLTGFAVLAVDVGRIFIVRNELQNAADAAALAGANCLTRQSESGTTNCLSAMATSLNWDRAAAKAQAQLNQNQADNRSISSTDAGHVIDVGYWDLFNKRPSGGTLPTSPMLTALSSIGTVDKPAIRVKVSKAAGQNGGPILMLTRLMFGGSDVPMSATSVAVISSPGSVFAGTLIPMAINKCLFDTYWDSSNNVPFTANLNTLAGVPQVLGEPWVFRIGSSYHYGSCDSGQWTSFGDDTNSAMAMKDLISGGNPTALSVGDATYVQAGTKTSGYKELLKTYPMPAGVDVLVPVVDYPSGLDAVNTSIPIVAFAVFHITDIQGGSGKYIEGYFKGSQTFTNTSGVGPSYGAYTPPRLAY